MLELFGLPELILEKDGGWCPINFGLVGLVFPGPAVVDAADPSSHPVVRLYLTRSIWPIDDIVLFIEEPLECPWSIRGDAGASFLVTRIKTRVTFDWSAVLRKRKLISAGVARHEGPGWYRLVVQDCLLADIRVKSREFLENA